MCLWDEKREIENEIKWKEEEEEELLLLETRFVTRQTCFDTRSCSFDRRLPTCVYPRIHIYIYILTCTYVYIQPTIFRPIDVLNTMWEIGVNHEIKLIFINFHFKINKYNCENFFFVLFVYIAIVCGILYNLFNICIALCINIEIGVWMMN